MSDLVLVLCVVSIVLSILSVVVVFIIQRNIVSMLDKDKLVFDKNFELKKQAIAQSLDLVDHLDVVARSNEKFLDAAKSCYNNLLCVVTNMRVAQLFYSLAIENANVNPLRIEEYKNLARKDIGFKIKKAK